MIGKASLLTLTDITVDSFLKADQRQSARSKVLYATGNIYSANQRLEKDIAVNKFHLKVSIILFAEIFLHPIRIHPMSLIKKKFLYSSCRALAQKFSDVVSHNSLCIQICIIIFILKTL